MLPRYPIDCVFQPARGLSLTIRSSQEACNLGRVKQQPAADSRGLELASPHECANRVRRHREQLCHCEQREHLGNTVRHHSPRCFRRASTASTGTRQWPSNLCAFSLPAQIKEYTESRRTRSRCATSRGESSLTLDIGIWPPRKSLRFTFPNSSMFLSHVKRTEHVTMTLP